MLIFEAIPPFEYPEGFGVFQLLVIFSQIITRDILVNRQEYTSIYTDNCKNIS